VQAVTLFKGSARAFTRHTATRNFSDVPMNSARANTHANTSGQQTGIRWMSSSDYNYCKSYVGTTATTAVSVIFFSSFLAYRLSLVCSDSSHTRNTTLYTADCCCGTVCSKFSSTLVRHD
jgi:hypothetical protein